MPVGRHNLAVLSGHVGVVAVRGGAEHHELGGQQEPLGLHLLQRPCLTDAELVCIRKEKSWGKKQREGDNRGVGTDMGETESTRLKNGASVHNGER